jgi:hypothetical protein
VKRSIKIFVFAMCILAAVGLVCIGVGVVLGGDFGGVMNDIGADLYARLEAAVTLLSH